MKKVLPKNASSKDVLRGMVRDNHEWSFVSKAVEAKLAELDGTQDQVILKEVWGGWSLLVEAKIDGMKFKCGEPDSIIFYEMA